MAPPTEDPARPSPAAERTVEAGEASPPARAALGRGGLAARAVGGAVLGIGLAVLAGWLLGVDVGELERTILQVSPLAVAGAALSAYVMIGLQSLRWSRVMMPLLGVPWPEAFRIQIAVAMLNALIPARGGDLLRLEYFSRRTGRSRATILGRELVDRWLDFSGWIPTFLIVCLVGSPPRWLLEALGAFAGLLGLWAVVMFVLARRGYRPRPDSRLGRLWEALRSGIDAFSSKRTLWIALALAPLPWLWETFVLTQVAAAFGFELTMVMAFSVLMAFNLAMAIPSPGAVGTVEAGGTAALVFFGVDQSKALAFMLVYHMAQLLPAIVGGAVVLVLGGDELRRRSPAEVDGGALARL